MSDAVDVAIVGAGPYGLSLAAHLSAAGVRFRQAGLPMHLWRSAMPAGMLLKSQGFASDLSSPGRQHTLEAYCLAHGLPYAGYGTPVPLDRFVAYGLWFQRELAPGLEQTLATRVAAEGPRFSITLASGDAIVASHVVVAVGVEHFAAVPRVLAALPAWACTHSSAHTEMAAFRGRAVVVVGAGQSALESAALLHENGAEVHLVARRAALSWNGPPLPRDRTLLARFREPEAGLGSGWGTWFYSRHPGLFRHLPESTRVALASTALGPAGACWLAERVSGRFPVLLGQTLTRASAERGRVRLEFESAGRDRRELTADHVIAATGYRTDLSRLGFLGDDLRRRLTTVAGSPVVDRHYQSSVPRLYFIGPAVAPAFGPVMRFVCGSGHAASTVTHHLRQDLNGRAHSRPAAGVPR